MELSITLDDSDGRYEPRSRISGSVEVRSAQPWEVDRAELLLFWRTEGRGDEDHGVASLLELAEKKQQASPTLRRSFHFPAPVMPWTYHGQKIKIHWILGVYIKEDGEPEVHHERTVVIHPDCLSFDTPT